MGEYLLKSMYLLFCCRLREGALIWWDCALQLWHHTRLCTLQQNKQTVQLMLQNMTEIFSSESWELFFSVPTLWVFFRAGEVTAIVIGVMCGCVGLAVIVRFIVKTIRWARRTPLPPLSVTVTAFSNSNQPDLTVRVPSLGRFFTLLHRETVVVNRWFTCFPSWHSCTADACSAASLTRVPPPDRNVLEHWSEGYGGKLEPTKKGERFMTDWFVPHWFRLRQEHP